MKNLVRNINLTVLFLSLAFAVSAQKPAPTSTPNASVGGDEPSKTIEVRLPVTVYDKNKKENLISGFTQSDFIVLEDGAPQEITYFSDEKNNPPVYVGVLMDTSESTKGKMQFSKEAAQTFLYSVISTRKDKAALMTFDNETNLVLDFTDRRDDLQTAVDKINKTGSQTALYDAVWQFCDEKLRGAPGRRVIVLITDGDDTFSRADLRNAIDIAQRTETTIFAISTKEAFLGSVPGIEGGTIKDKGDKDLERLCNETGGKMFVNTGSSKNDGQVELERALTKISNEFHQQYIITYRPANQNYDGKNRKIEVRFRNPGGSNGKYKIRSKTSYRNVRDSLK